MKFPYQSLKGKHYPIVPIILKRGKKQFKTEALVDSGAHLSLFHSEIADYLGIKLEKGKKIFLEGLDGRILAYIHRLNIEIDGYSFPCQIAFSREFFISVNILGREDFFERFKIIFEEKKKILGF